MNNIKLFEDFSDEDLEGLLDDMKELGFETPIEGFDFGFGPDLKGKNDGKTPLYLNQNCMDFLDKKGLVKWKTNPQGYQTTSVISGIWDLFRSKLKNDEMWNLFGKVSGLEFPKIQHRDFVYRYTLPKDEKKEMRVVLLKDVFTSRYFPIGQFRTDKPHPINSKTVKMIYGFVVEILQNK